MTILAQKTYKLLRNVPKGKVTTYKALANVLGTKAYQAIGQIMKKNPYAPQVPCHRVVSSDGKIGGFKGSKTGPTIKEKINLLREEGIEIADGKITNFEKDFIKPSF